MFDLYDHSFPPPGEDGIPYVGPFANEPTYREQVENCQLACSQYESKKKIICYCLETIKDVSAGMELVWDYGPGYRREYPSKYDN